MVNRKQQDTIDIVAVAKLAGVSPSTVSRAFNHPDLVHPETRKRIDSAVRRSGYIRNRAAQAIHGRRSATIGLVVPTVNHAIFSEVVQSFNETVSAQGFTVLLASHGYDLAAEYQVVRKLMEHRVDGIALIGLDHSPDTLRLLQRQQVATLAIWNYAPDSALPCIGADNAEAGRIAAEHLRLLGHRRIGLLFPSTDGNDRARARLSAALQTLAEAGIEVPDEYRAETPYSLSQSKRACIDLLARPGRPTALLCGNDIIAHGAVFAAQKLGLSIPREISIIGIGDFAGSAEMEPALTTVRIPARRIGASAGLHLIDLIARPDAEPILRIPFEVELIMRATTGPPLTPSV